MGESTEIAWTDHTFNPWWGCQRVSPGCENCYAETFSKRLGFGTTKGAIWGAKSERRLFGDKHWAEPLKWEAAARAAGVRRRVFCASMADVFEARQDLDEPRERLFKLIEETPNLDWQLLTKRPENMTFLAPERWRSVWPENAWAGTTVEDRRRRDVRGKHLLGVPAKVLFLSMEPLLEEVSIRGVLPQDARIQQGINWVIVGGESGHGARRFNARWAWDLIADCRESHVPVFIKQLGDNLVTRNDDNLTIEGEPGFWPGVADGDRVEHDVDGVRDDYQGALVRLRLRKPKGGDLAEWPEEMRIRMFPGDEWPSDR